MSKRSSSAKLFFYDLHGGGAKVQVMADARYLITISLLFPNSCLICYIFWDPMSLTNCLSFGRRGILFAQGLIL
jgi:hypothetical protein